MSMNTVLCKQAMGLGSRPVSLNDFSVIPGSLLIMISKLLIDKEVTLVSQLSLRPIDLMSDLAAVDDP